MVKLVLISVVVGLMAAPLIAARDPSPGRGLRKAFAYTLAADVLYLLLLRFVLPRLY